MSDWKMPDWMEPYKKFFSETSDLENTMSGYNAKAADLIGTATGRAVATNAQVRMLVRLRSAGLLKEVPACPLEESHGEEGSEGGVQVGQET